MIDPGVRLARQLRRPALESPIRYATVISRSPSTGTAVVRPSTASATDGSEDITATCLDVVPPAVGAVVRIDVYKGDVLILGTPALDSLPGVPFAMESGLQNITVLSGATQQVGSAVTFQTGRFTVTPNITFGINGAASSIISMVRMSGAPSSTGFTPVVNMASAPGTNITFPVAWTAVQMTSTTAGG